MTKILVLVLIITSINISCKESTANKLKNHKEQDNKMKLDTIKKGYFLTGYNNMPMDTVFYDSVVIMACFTRPAIIDNKFYLAYSKSEITYAKGIEIHRIYKSHFLNSYSLENLPAKNGELFNINEIISSDKEIELGDSYAFDTNVDIERIKDFPNSDSLIYIHVRVPEYSGTYRHFVIEKKSNGFIKLFDFLSSDYLIEFNLIDSTIVECEYNLFLEDISESDTLRFNLETRELIENEN